jgi:hypothetical protein
MTKVGELRSRGLVAAVKTSPSENGADVRKARTQGFSELGVTGLRRQAGVILEEPLRELQGERGRKVYREMSTTDDVVGALLFAIEMLIRQMDWRAEAGEETPEGEADAEYLEEVKIDMSHTWEDLIAEILSMLPYGWAWHEIVLKRRAGPIRNSPGESSRFTDGKIGVRKIPIRSQDSLIRWLLDDKGGVQGILQRDPNQATQPIAIPIEKSLLFRAGAHRNSPEGVSVLRRAWRSWYFKKRIQEIEAIGIERELTGVAVAGVPPEIMDENAHPDDQAIFREIQKVVTNLRLDEQAGVVMPLTYDPETGKPLYSLELLSSPGTRSIPTVDVRKMYDRAIAGTLLGDFILVGHEETGSFALHSDKTSLFTVALGAWADSIQEVFNRHLVPRLFAVNGWQREVFPRYVHGDIEKVDLRLLAEIVREMAQSGMALFPDDNLEDHFRELLNFPPRDVSPVEPPRRPAPRPGEEENPEELPV